MLATFHWYKQLDSMDCGPICLRMVAKYHGKNISLQTLREKTQIGKEGVNLLDISEAGETIGFRANCKICISMIGKRCKQNKEYLSMKMM